jgi:hypothetical protein
VNLNTATSLELGHVPGIGPLTADKTLQIRESYGQFKGFGDLRASNGPMRMEKIRKYVTVGKTVAARKPANALNNKILDSSVCLQINIRAATENRESGSADTALVTAQS